MKYLQIFPLCCIAALACSCMEKHRPDINRGVDITVLEAMTEYEVPVREGYTTSVSYNGDLLAETQRPMTILVPAAAIKSRSEGLEVRYTKEEILNEFGLSTYWQYISFEDTRDGDYDYNDVVLHCRVMSNVPYDYVDNTGNVLCTHTVSVQPVALGGTRSLALGILYQDDSGALCEQILCEDIRRDLFFGNPNFPINTDAAIPAKKVTNYLTDFLTCKTHEKIFRVVWFLQAGSDRLYAATTNFGVNGKLNMISADGNPYGLILTKKWRYPVERCHIRDAYPGFGNWLRTGDETALLANSNISSTFPATIRVNQEDGDLWDWQRRPQ